MKLLYVFAIAIICISVVTALRCRSCFSDKSWRHCNSVSTNTRCPTKTLKCVRVRIRIEEAGNQTTRYFLKGCAKTCSANNVAYCRKGRDFLNNKVSCNVRCCKKNLCN